VYAKSAYGSRPDSARVQTELFSISAPPKPKNLRLLIKENTMTQSSVAARDSKQAADKNAIRPFPHVNVPEAELTELRRRINATKWPER
jgi:hypothetical protein